MKTTLLAVFILAAQSPQFYYDALQESRNPFAPATEIPIIQSVPAQEEPQEPDTAADPIDPEMVVKLDRLKAILKTNSNKSMLYLGDEIVEISDRFYGMSVVEITLDRVILQNDHHVVEKVIGKPVEIKPLIGHIRDELPYYGENQE